MTGEWESPRAKLDRQRIAKHLAFEAIMSMVDDGQITRSNAFAGMALDLSLLSVEPADQWQGVRMRQAEREIDGAGGA